MTFHLFERFGVEIEHMIVQEATLDVLPVSDQLLRLASGGTESEIEVGNAGWSNELVLHVLEFKTKEPVPSLAPVAKDLHAGVSRANQLLKQLGGRLLPTAMHPWMDPSRETHLWPHDSAEIYSAFNRIFDCRGHGWSNLQSVHINLPFSGDAEFVRLHAAIRLVLPLLPMLAASSPVVEGIVTSTLDSRLAFYRKNCARLPCVTAHVIPEAVSSEAEYRERIFAPIANAVRPFDHEHVLDPEWVNARGAIARFSRGSIEIRVLDVQECPAMDLAIVHAVVALVRHLVEERGPNVAVQQSFDEQRLLRLFEAGVRYGSQAQLEDKGYLEALGGNRQTGRALWASLCALLVKEGHLANAEASRLECILRQGTLAERILARLGRTPTRERLLAVYTELGHCLDQNLTYEV